MFKNYLKFGKYIRGILIAVVVYLLVPSFIAGGLFLYLKPYLGREFLSTGRLPLSFALAAGEYVPVGVTEGANQQIFVGEPARLITNTSVAKAQVSRSGKYVVWMQELRGGWQIVLHHLGSGETLPLTIAGNNLNPQLAGETIAWEQVRGDKRNVIVFDGRGTRRVVSEGVAINPSLSEDGGKLVFATREKGSQDPTSPFSLDREKVGMRVVDQTQNTPHPALSPSGERGIGTLSEGEWTAVEYDLASGQHKEVARSLEAKHPFYRGGDGTLAFGLMEQQANSRIAGARHIQLTGRVPSPVPAPEPKHRQRTVADTLAEFNQTPLITNPL